MRNVRAGRFRPARIFSAFGVAVALATVAPMPAFASAGSNAATVAREQGGQGIDDFYRARSGRPLWFGDQGRQAEILLELLESASIDGLDPRKYRPASLRRAYYSARGGNARAVRRTDRMLSEALVAYARDLRRPVDNGVIYVDPALRPTPPSPRAVLDAAASAPSVERFMVDMGWMHPLYAQIRHALLEEGLDSAQRRLARLNLERVREFPAGKGRHVLVNAAAQRLYMYEDGRVVDSMRVVVGKPIYPTPMMAASIRYTSLNPYWYVPTDLAAERIAPNVVKGGVKYLKSHGYQLLNEFSRDAQVLDPASVDWQAVVDGKEKVYLRQLPGPGNSMGRMKFMFPNSQGVYLHDTPEKELLEEASRLFSGGCVRLEDAPRLGRWLYGRKLQPQGNKPEQQLPLDEPVPVFLTYLTAVPSGDFNLAFFDDIYGRDAQKLAASQGSSAIASR